MTGVLPAHDENGARSACPGATVLRCVPRDAPGGLPTLGSSVLHRLDVSGVDGLPPMARKNLPPARRVLGSRGGETAAVPRASDETDFRQARPGESPPSDRRPEACPVHRG